MLMLAAVLGPGQFSVPAAAAPVPDAMVLSAAANPPQLLPGGGTVTVTGVVTNASTCQLELLSSQSFAVVYSHNPTSCTAGSFSARVTIGPNPTPVPRTVAFALVARNSVSGSTSQIYVLLAAGGATTTAGTPPATTTGPASGPSVPVVTSQSSNWSGYAATGGPYTVVKGSFTVPSLSAGAIGNEQAAEWVGLDGMSASDPSLIQAGVDEYPDPSNPATVDVQAWWEILPAAVSNIASVSVKPGDKVTVTIWQLSGTTWEINLTDNTGNQSFTTPPEQYSGPGSSAEWIVEATTECRFQCRTVALAPYSPPVVFSGLGMTGPQATSLEAITMLQGAGEVSTPSALGTAEFTVTYTGGALTFGRRLAPLD